MVDGQLGGPYSDGPPKPPPEAYVDALVSTALREDLGDVGDVTSLATISEDAHARAHLVARAEGRIAGLDFAAAAFETTDPNIQLERVRDDGQDVRVGDVVLELAGSAQGLLAAERVALNFAGHLSGVATATRAFVRAIGDHRTRVCCTRKTTPGLRVAEKYAVRAGGGINHRAGLHDAILIKDNHIANAGGVEAALGRARDHAVAGLSVEIEVDTLEQLDQALDAGVDAVLLDNMSPAQLAVAVERIDGRAIAEASGGVTLETIADIAASGVDVISVGWLTHSAPSLDLALDFLD